ncbi:ComEC/Rec2 family competence protein [Spirochaeta cellobiosiphila]|uniref:ComEC/Rec2 family competence protein n=1 Tax=Spirochaeta cellobiosiphila TaxID=504483 RepID=UPI00146F639D|nr:ComEC/Rec2 family competence protein [Spirochaeta cellobiosiphila]
MQSQQLTPFDPLSLILFSSLLFVILPLPALIIILPCLCLLPKRIRIIGLCLLIGAVHGLSIRNKEPIPYVKNREINKTMLLLEDVAPGAEAKGAWSKVLILRTSKDNSIKQKGYKKAYVPIVTSRRLYRGQILRMDPELHLYNDSPYPVRAAFWQALDKQMLSWKREEGSLWLALTTGERIGLSEEVKSLFTMSGAAPLLALSGLHIALIALCFQFIPERRIAYALQVVFLVLYLYLINPGPSLIRAVLLVIISGLWALTDYQRYPGNTLGLTFLIHTLIQPANLYSLSFQLSYAALFGIMYGAPLLKNLLWKEYPLCLLNKFTVPLSVFLFTSPLLIKSFDVLYWVGLISNTLLVFPMVLFILAGLLTLMIRDCQPLLSWSYQFFIMALEVFAKFPPLYNL